MSYKERIKYIIKILSLAMLVWFTFCMAVIWFSTFFVGGVAIFSINTYGEMLAELIMWIVCAPIIVYGVYLYQKDVT